MFSQGERSKHSILAQPTFETVIAMIADDDFLNDEDHELSWRTITIMFFLYNSRNSQLWPEYNIKLIWKLNHIISSSLRQHIPPLAPLYHLSGRISLGIQRLWRWTVRTWTVQPPLLPQQRVMVNQRLVWLPQPLKSPHAGQRSSFQWRNGCYTDAFEEIKRV